MNFEEILSKVLAIADYPQDKRQDFINTFYEYLFMRLVSAVREVDPDSADKVMALNAQGADAEDFKKVFEEISKNEKVKETIDKVSAGVVGELVDDIANSATEEQKKQILSTLPQ